MLNLEIKNIEGNKYGRLLVKDYAYSKKHTTGSAACWKCLCDCGKEKIIDGRSLRNGTTRSCGCLMKEINSKKAKGIPFTEEHRKRISNAHKGKKQSKEHNRKISESKIGIYKGKDNPNWRGGIDRGLYSFEFVSKSRELTRKRDRYQCQICEIKESDLKGYQKKLSVHHIDYNKINNNLQNLITLCKSCHSKTSFNRQSWKYYFQSYQGEENFRSILC